ncbi:MAG: hypothetical protein GF307_03415, partial [candidate division Zixibacteria bacterium]|nr:hypothetical protein [candidate division Zixibacteria bacterium]
MKKYLLLIILSVSTTNSHAQEPVLMEGWPVLIHEGSILGSPLQGLTIYDIDANGTQEIFFGFRQKIHAYDFLGNSLSGWPYIDSNPDTKFYNSPIIGDIDGDNRPEIVDDWINLSDNTSYLLALNDDGGICAGFPVELMGGSMSNQLSLFDLDNDGSMEIIVGAHRRYPFSSHQLRVYRGNGELYGGWPVEGINAGGFAVGDIDNDEHPEIVVTAYDGFLFAFEANGSLLEGFPVTVGALNDSVIIDGPPALFDLEQDGTLEIALLYGIPRYPPPLTQGYVTIYNHRGDELTPWPYYYEIWSPVSLSVGNDVSDNRNYLAFGGTYNGQFLLVDALAGEVLDGWPFYTPHPAGCNWDKPSIGDIDGDGSPDYLFNYNVETRDSITGLYQGRIWALNKGGELLEHFPLWVYGCTFPGGIALGDVDNDGVVEMVFHSKYSAGGRPTQRIYLYKLQGVPYIPERFPWPMSSHDPQHTNNLHHPIQTSVREDKPSLPAVVTLTNHPNPFNSATVIEYAVEEKGEVLLE